jgi:hypothetical protein
MLAQRIALAVRRVAGSAAAVRRCGARAWSSATSSSSGGARGGMMDGLNNEQVTRLYRLTCS